MNSSSGYKVEAWHIRAELLTIRQIAGHSALLQAATYLVREAAGGYAGLDHDPFIEAILAHGEVGAEVRNDPRGSIAGARRRGSLQAGCDKHSQAPQAAWHKRRGRLGLIREVRGPSYPWRRRASR
jgi:hypothetical protein